jgi:histidine ammonia-lyase
MNGPPLDSSTDHLRHAVTVGDTAPDLAGFVAVCEGAELAVADVALERVGDAERALSALLDGGATIYGVTTGYGAASGRAIAVADREAFQLATVRSHACGTGPALAWAPARGVWLAKILSIATGGTGAGVGLVEAMVALLNAGFAPDVPRTGSLGASGDLVPSGHAALALLGEGDVLRRDGSRVAASEALTEAGVPAVRLGPRDGLSLVNGTAATTSLTAYACVESERLLDIAERVAAASLEAVGGHPEAYSPEIVGARPHPGAIAAAAGVRRALDGIDPARLGRHGLHDPYAWWCLPQVHGAARAACGWTASTCAIELASCTDNPLVGPDGTVLSGGNFHGAPLGLVADLLRMAIGEVAALSRQRTSHLAAALHRQGDEIPLIGGIPLMGGIGLTMVLTTATASLLEISSTGAGTGNWLPVDTVEDHVPNATIAALHALNVLEHARAVVAAEVVATGVILQGLDAPPTSVGGRWVTSVLHDATAELRLDRPLTDVLERVRRQLRSPTATGPH